jgi:hypothetical protein
MKLVIFMYYRNSNIYTVLLGQIETDLTRSEMLIANGGSITVTQCQAASNACNRIGTYGCQLVSAATHHALVCMVFKAKIYVQYAVLLPTYSLRSIKTDVLAFTPRPTKRVAGVPWPHS